MYMTTIHPVNHHHPDVPNLEDSSTGGVFYASMPSHHVSPVGRIGRETLYLGTLDTIVDRLQELFVRWEEQRIFPEMVRTDMLNRAQLAAHEWIAHLVQYADFEGRVPQIALSIWIDVDSLCCLIADNSRGFSLEAYCGLEKDDTCYVMPERGMHWLIIQASTKRLTYRPLGNQGFGLEFSIT